MSHKKKINFDFNCTDERDAIQNFDFKYSVDKINARLNSSNVEKSFLRPIYIKEFEKTNRKIVERFSTVENPQEFEKNIGNKAVRSENFSILYKGYINSNLRYHQIANTEDEKEALDHLKNAEKTSDKKIKFKFLKLAARLNNSKAYFLLSQNYKYGEGVDANHEVSWRNLVSSAKLGNDMAIKYLINVKRCLMCDLEATSVFYPCLHKISCKECSLIIKLKYRNCSKCRVEISSIAHDKDWI